MAKYIDAEAFFKLINTTLPYRELDYPDKAVYNAAISDVCDMLIHFPPADVQEVRHGRWIEADDMPRLDNTFSIRCSLCGQLMLAHPNDENPNFCCNCGAKMDEVGE